MVWKKASILRFLMLACFGISLLAFSSRGANDDFDVRGADVSADNSIFFRSSVATDTFAKRTSELDQDLIDLGVKLEDGFISVDFRRNYVDYFVLPLYASKKELNFSASQGPECLEENQHWQFSYPTSDGKSKSYLNIIWDGENYRKLRHDADADSDEAIYRSPSKYMNVALIGRHMDISNEGNDRAGSGKTKFALEPAVSDVRGYFDMGFSIKNVVGLKVSDKSGKCDLTLKFSARDYKLRAASSAPATTTKKANSERNMDSTHSPDNLEPSEDLELSEDLENKVGTSSSILVWIVVVPIVGFICMFVWYFMFRRTNSDDGSTKLDAVVSSAAGTTPILQSSAMSARESYGSKRGEAKKKRTKGEKKPKKRSPQVDKAAGRKKGRGINK